MNVLSREALVLLEDVDSAGLGRELSRDSKKRKDKAEEDAEDDMKSKDEASESKITLSGLLNAIDGPHAPEGHILIMTTNHPDALDEALIRPGRVDLEVEFKYAGRAQVCAMFVRMYDDGNMVSDEEDSGLMTKEELHTLAATFAERVPEAEFSPAQFQEFLVPRKKDPRKAVEEVEAWVEKVRKRRVAKTKAAEDKSSMEVSIKGEGECGSK